MSDQRYEGIPTFDIGEFQSPPRQTTDADSKLLPIQKFANKARDDALNPTTASDDYSNLPSNEAKHDDHCEEIVVLRNIGDINITLSSKHEDSSLMDRIFSSPTLLLLHAFRVKHHLKFSESCNAFDLSFRNSTEHFNFKINDHFDSEYSCLRNLLQKLGLYGGKSSDQLDIWLDTFLNFASHWTISINEHVHLIKKLVSDNATEQHKQSIPHYLNKRGNLYKKLSSLTSSLDNLGRSDQEDPRKILIQHLLFREGATREVVLELITHYYNKLWKSKRDEDSVIGWIRSLHTDWSVDYLLEYQDLYDLHSEIMENEIISGWYQERELMSSHPDDPSRVLIFHESIMNGTFHGLREIPDEAIQVPERSAVLSPRSKASPLYTTANVPVSPNSDEIDPYYEDSRFPINAVDSYHPHQYASNDFDELHPPKKPSMKYAYETRMWQQPETDWFADDNDDVAIPYLSKKSPMHQSICNARPTVEKKRFGFC